MAEKDRYQSFESSWAKTLNWAHSQGIPTSSVLPVYEMDAQRMLAGQGSYQMYEAERIRAILASYNPNNVTPLPTDHPAGGITGFFHNVMHDAENIFTGLQPTHLVKSIYDSVANTVEHPGWLFDPTKNTIAQLIPGVSLIGEYEQGGIDNVLAHPLITALNVLGVASGVTDIIGHTALADSLAGALGVPGGRAAIGGRQGLGPLGIARTAVANIKTGTEGFAKDASGLTTFGPLTISARVKNWTNTKGVGSDLGAIGEAVHGRQQAAAATFKDLVTEFVKQAATLRDQTLTVADAALYSVPAGTVLSYEQAAYNLVTMSAKTYADLAVNDSVPVAIKAMLPHYERAQEWLEKAGIASGDLTPVLMPDGSYEIYRKTGSEARAITAARDALDKSTEKADKLMEPVDRLAAEIQANDKAVQPGLASIAQLGAQMAVLIKRPMAQELRTTLLPTSKVDRNWHDLGLNHDTVSRLLSVKRATITQGRTLKEVFGPGALIEQIATAYERNDFGAFRDLTAKLDQKLSAKTLGTMGIGGANRLDLVQLRIAAKSLKTYGSERAKREKQMLTAGRNAAYEVERQQKLQAKWERAVEKNPSAQWQPLFVKAMNDYIAKSEEGKLAVEQALSDKRFTKDMTARELARIRAEPGLVIALVRTYLDASLEAPFGATIDRGTIEEAKKSAEEFVTNARAHGEKPHYVPNFSSRNTLGTYEPGEMSFSIHVNPAQYSIPDFVRDRLMDQSNTIYDVTAGFTRAMKQQLQSEATVDVIDNFLIPKFGYKQSEIMPHVFNENPTLGLAENVATRQAYLAQYMEDTLGMERFDPKRFGIVSTSRHIAGDDAVWMPKSILAGLEQITRYQEEELTGLFKTPTRIFRTSVLGYSPRFVAHILFGGSFLMALREPTSFLKLPDAFKMLKDPEFRAEIHTRSTQVGADEPISFAVRQFHGETGKTMARMWLHEMMDKAGLDPSKVSSWLQVIPHATFKLTNFMTDMQRAAVVLDSTARLEKRGQFIDPVTGEVTRMTHDQAMEAGVEAANKVMGNLAHMTPLERNLLTTIMPFYGWTKHIIAYVGTYPVDHPYRAVFLAYLANMNSDSVSKGLYTRIQNLFFLGSPDAQGNVSAMDVRFLNPLRDVANYATLGGFISTLNPVISAPFAMVDPEILFGSNVLYPNLTYNQLYGTETAAPAGSWITGVEQFVPEAGAVDAAFGLSAQYRNLAKTNPNSFARQIFGALNIPFAQVQHLNLKQIAARQEIDRYRSASQAATQAWQSGQFDALSGYGAVPNPLQLDYNISPAQLQAIYQAALAQGGGLAPSEIVPPLPAPPGL
jgi:hypothetical protein